MLRKLFISFFIFSILSADGVVNAPADIFDFYMSLSSQYNLAGRVDVSDDQQRDASEGIGQLCPTIRYIAISLPADSSGRLAAKDISAEFTPVDIAGFSYESVQLIQAPSSINEEYIVFTSSDSSPPQSL
jgi:hypothetical protein